MLASSAVGQSRSTGLPFRYDTTISAGVLRSASYQRVLLEAVSSAQEAWTYVPSPESTDTLLFVRCDLRAMACTRYRVVVPGLQLQIDRPRYASLAADPQRLALLFGHVVVLLNIIQREGGSLIYRNSIPLVEPFDYVGLDDSNLLLGRYYDYTTASASKKVVLTSLNLVTGEVHEIAPID